MWFPKELWRIIKNYQLGKEYWIRIFRQHVLTNLPKIHKFSYEVYTSATKSIRFIKEIEKTPFLKKPREITIIYSVI